MKKLIFTIALFSLTFSCKKQIIKSEIEKKWAYCRETYDKQATLQKLVGNWKLVAIGCAFCDKSGIKPLKDLNNFTQLIEIRITSDQKMSTYENGNLTGTTDFNLVDSYNEGYFSIKIIPMGENNYTYGIIEFCNDVVAFKNSYIDGADFYYERIK